MNSILRLSGNIRRAHGRIVQFAIRKWSTEEEIINFPEAVGDSQEMAFINVEGSEQLITEEEKILADPTQKLPNIITDDYTKYTSLETYASTRKPIEEAYSLSPECYLNPKYLEIEHSKIFKKAWVAVGLYDTVRNDGDAISITIGNTPIIVTNYKGKLYGFYNVCRHRGSTLLKEGIYKNANVIKCPYHCWTYDCKGKLIGTPYFNDNKIPLNNAQRKDRSKLNKTNDNDCPKINFNKDNFGLFEINVKTWGINVFVNLNPDFEESNQLWDYQVGNLFYDFDHYPFKDMKMIGNSKFSVEANWKLVNENFVEYYHLPWVHPELVQVSVANHVIKHSNGHYCLFATSPLTEGGTMADPSKFKHFDGLKDEDHYTAWFVHLFPNLNLFIFPNHIVSLIAFPDGKDPGKCRELFSVVMRNDVEYDPEEIKKLNDYYTLVNIQDLEAVQRVQAGINCDVYKGGIMSPKYESMTYKFQNLVIDYMCNQYMKRP